MIKLNIAYIDIKIIDKYILPFISFILIFFEIISGNISKIERKNISKNVKFVNFLGIIDIKRINVSINLNLFILTTFTFAFLLIIPNALNPYFTIIIINYINNII